MYTLWIQQYMVIVKPSMSSLKIYTFWHQAIATPSTRLHDVFKKFVIMSGAKPFKRHLCVTLCLFVQSSNFYGSTIPFRLVFDNLLKI